MAFYSDVLIPRTGVPESPLLVLCPPALQPLRPDLGPLPPAFGHLPVPPRSLTYGHPLEAPQVSSRLLWLGSPSRRHHVVVRQRAGREAQVKAGISLKDIKKGRWREGEGQRSSRWLSRSPCPLSATPSPGGRKDPLSILSYLLFLPN